jgi:hypothetical protein
MAFAQGSRSQLTYILEQTYGTTPTPNPAMSLLPVNSHTISLQKEIIESGEIRSDRQVNVLRHGNKSVAGQIEVEFRPIDYDELLEGALFGDFDSEGELRLGTAFKSFSFEDGALDINQYRVFSGCGINSLSLNIQPNQIVTASFDILGSGAAAASGSSIDSTPTAGTSATPFDSFSGTIIEGGSTIAIISGIEFTVDNSLGLAYVIGSSTAPQMEYGRGRVSGTLTAYFENSNLLNKFINETESSIRFTLDGTTDYVFDFPRVKYNGGDIPLDNEQSRLITLPFVALYEKNNDFGTSLKISKV